MSDVEVGEEDRPLETIQLLGVEVLWNPFDDIVPRAVQIKRVENLLINADAPKKKRKALRDTKVLSFQDDHEEEGAITVKKHSIHDSKMLKDSKLKAEVNV
jgi:peptidyl-prolyl cis-trans isomerase SDCCAG10